MAPRFLGKTTLDGLEPVAANGRPVLDAYSTLRSLLHTTGAAANLFAEPVGTWQAGEAIIVSWYTDALGEPEDLVTASADRRQQIAAQLRMTLADLAPLLADPQAGPLLRRALVVARPDGIKSIDGHVVLTEWGLATPDVARADDPLAVSALAAYLPATAPPSPPSVSVGVLPLRTAVPPVVPLLPVPVPAVRSVWDLWLIPAGLVLAAVFLVLGLWLGARLVAERVAARPNTVKLFDEAAARGALEQQQAQNAALERELEERRRALSGNVCVADPAQMPRIGPDHAAAVPPAAVPPPPGAPTFHGNLAELLTQGVVMVLAPQGNGMETGTGFFVTPDTLVTNRHVIEHSMPGKLFVTGGKITRALPAEVIAKSPELSIGKLDIALLRVNGVEDVQPLALATTAAPLDMVVAAGFPALTIRGDEAFGRLMQGDASAVPQVILTDGRINAIQTSPAGLKIMPHSAQVSGGNSGGPLSDACGRVVGVNTFITADREQVAHVNYAQKSDEVLAFLKDHGVNASVLSDTCTPQAARGPTAPGTAAPDPAAAGAPPPAPAKPAP